MKAVIKNPKNVLIFILLILVTAVLIDLPKIPIKFSYKKINIDTSTGGYSINLLNGKFARDLEIKKGLDIKGGIRVLLEADMSGVLEADQNQSLESARSVIERRINALGVAEPSITSIKSRNSYRISVEIPGATDPTQAVRDLQQVAFLEFRELKPIEVTTPPESTIEATPQEDFFATDLSGKDLKRAALGFDPNNPSKPLINLTFTTDGAAKFEAITERNIQKPLAIFLDGNLIQAPTVQEKITGGSAQITGQFTLEEVTQVVRLLNAGSLPVPLKVISQENISATLGAESVSLSFKAGTLGLLVVMFFMILMYGRLGVLANVALFIYAALTLAFYKLIPVVLTLPGIAGFILSIGMAVDSNILIFERIKEELRNGKPRSIALENGFGRAWDSIRDANIATLITCFLLFNPFGWNFLNTSGPIRGFALTLALGIFISLFTGIIVTRNLVRVFYKVK